MENLLIYVTVRLKDKLNTIIGNKISTTLHETENEKDIAQGVALQLAKDQAIPLSWIEYGYSVIEETEPEKFYEIEVNI